MTHFGFIKRITIFYLYCFSTLFLFSCSPKKDKGDESSDLDKLYTVKRSNFTIGTLLTGTVNAKKKYKLALEAGVNTNLNWIVDENTMVKAGDVVIKFEDEELIQKIEEQKVSVDSSEKGLLIEREKRRMLESENKAAIRVAMDKVTTAEEALSRYLKYDAKKEKRSKELAVVNAKKAYDDAKKAYLAKADYINNKIYDSESDKEADLKARADLKQKMDTAENTYRNANLDLKIFKRYTNPSKLTQLKNSLDQTKLNLQKVKISTASSLVQKDNNIFKLEKQNKKLLKDLKRYEEYLPMLQVKAPVDGIVVYGDMDRRRGKVEVKIGMSVRRKQVLATIPDMNNLIVDFELPEQFRHRVHVGAEVVITPESIPTLKIPGKVSDIAMVPVNQIRWDASSPKIYTSKITLDVQNKKLVSGMNVQVEIITDVLHDVISIPIEAVFEEDGEYFVYRKGLLKTEKRIVELGKSNEDFVQITKGLEVGDVVFLYRPFERGSSE